jgi:hypothetical protein
MVKLRTAPEEGIMLETPKFVQGVFPFVGHGLESPVSLAHAEYTAPRDRRAQLTYLRAGNSTAEMIYLLLLRNEKPMRYFPIGAKCSVHVPLVIVEDIEPETKLSLSLAAPDGVRGVVVIDVGLVEI